MRYILLLCLLPACARHEPTVSVSQAPASPPPNIIILMADDMRADQLAFMPRTLDWFAPGLTFRQAFVSLSHCCPSRVSILRGQYAHNHGVRNSGIATGGGFKAAYGLGTESSTLATWLHDAGYRTALIGKYLNGYPKGIGNPHYIPPGWDEWRVFSGDNDYFNYNLEENGVTVPYHEAAADYSTDVFARFAGSFVAAAPEPFFAIIAPRAPHAPFAFAPRYQGAFAGRKYPRGESFDEADVSDKPAAIQALPLHQSRNADYYFQGQLRVLAALDDLVDSVMTALQQRGVLERTVVVFVSDNGVQMREHRLSLGIKGTPYEETLHVPLMIRGPGITMGATDEMATNIDLAPTLADIAGVPVPAFVDGQSLQPLLVSGAPSGRHSFEIEVPNEGTVETPQLTGVRTDFWKYIERESGERELYDLVHDPLELANIIGTQPAVEVLLSTRLAAFRSCRGVSCRSIAREEGPP